MENVLFTTYTAASHQGEIQGLWVQNDGSDLRGRGFIPDSSPDSPVSPEPRSSRTSTGLFLLLFFSSGLSGLTLLSPQNNHTPDHMSDAPLCCCVEVKRGQNVLSLQQETETRGHCLLPDRRPPSPQRLLSVSSASPQRLLSQTSSPARCRVNYQKENGAPVRGGPRGDNSPEEIEERTARNETRATGRNEGRRKKKKKEEEDEKEEEEEEEGDIREEQKDRKTNEEGPREGNQTRGRGLRLTQIEAEELFYEHKHENRHLEEAEHTTEAWSRFWSGDGDVSRLFGRFWS
ncbi:unnamed protein product [Pleuronectes platessa]|uniref:Uncharacterized protein n=1 Tax=Pleuronectes platessa TaxID=8262 RepID=A0A9N7YHG4_PLEPL|nr:unnamed protein product [Pleuronectes platessa]